LKIAIVHNAYGRPSGEEVVIDNLAQNLEHHGHVVSRFTRCSAEIDSKRWGQVRAFFSGIYNLASRRSFAQFLEAHRPDVVHVHNLFPLISPSVLVEARSRDIPVVMTLHNFRLICPNGLLMRGGQVCHECLGGREQWCVLHNCEHNPAKSLGYALRTGIARRQRWFLNGVTHFICLTRFQRDLHVRQGFPSQRCSVIPNAVPTAFLRDPQAVESPLVGLAVPCEPPRPAEDPGAFVGYVGRLSPEKDILVLLDAAKRLPHIPFKLAGSLARMPDLPRHAPANVEFIGQLDRDTLRTFYAGIRLFVFTTRWYEGLPMVLLEAMAAGLPVVCTHIGGLPEVVQNGESGYLTPPGDAAELASKIDLLWQDQELAMRMGETGRERVLRKYHPDTVYAQHLEIYQRVQAAAELPLSCCV
jgi:glycosyltransferase involved in cell wall biosynthesis